MFVPRGGLCSRCWVLASCICEEWSYQIWCHFHVFGSCFSRRSGCALTITCPYFSLSPRFLGLFGEGMSRRHRPCSCRMKFSDPFFSRRGPPLPPPQNKYLLLIGLLETPIKVFGRIRRSSVGAREDAGERPAHQAPPADSVRPAARVQLAQDHPGACFNGIVPFSFWYFRRLPE